MATDREILTSKAMLESAGFANHKPLTGLDREAQDLMWCKMFKHVDADVLQTVVFKLAASETFFPAIKTVLDAVGNMTNPEIAEALEADAAFRKAQDLIGPIGRDRPEVAEARLDPITWDALMRTCGKWSTFCNWNTDEIVNLRPAFRREYDAAIKRSKEQAFIAPDLARKIETLQQRFAIGPDKPSLIEQQDELAEEQEGAVYPFDVEPHIAKREEQLSDSALATIQGIREKLFGRKEVDRTQETNREA